MGLGPGGVTLASRGGVGPGTLWSSATSAPHLLRMGAPSSLSMDLSVLPPHHHPWPPPYPQQNLDPGCWGCWQCWACCPGQGCPSRDVGTAIPCPFLGLGSEPSQVLTSQTCSAPLCATVQPRPNDPSLLLCLAHLCLGFLLRVCSFAHPGSLLNRNPITWPLSLKPFTDFSCTRDKSSPLSMAHDNCTDWPCVVATLKAH